MNTAFEGVKSTSKCACIKDDFEFVVLNQHVIHINDLAVCVVVFQCGSAPCNCDWVMHDF